MKKVSKRIEFGKSSHSPDLYVPSRWFLDDVEVTEMEYYGITPQTTLEDIGAEPRYGSVPRVEDQEEHNQE